MRILILTAGFGEGHNTASRCISEALHEQSDVNTKIVDIYLEAIPKIMKILKSGYGIAINKFPLIWGTIFTLLDKPMNFEMTLSLAGNLRKTLRRTIDEYRPNVIVSTFPLYAYLLRQLRKRGHELSKVPLLTMVTDSTTINSSWYRGGSDVFLLVDHETAQVLQKGGVERERIQVFGFPVTTKLATLKPLDLLMKGPRRIVYMPSSRVGHTLATIRALQALPKIELTIVTGRLKGLHATLERSRVADRENTQLIGWTDKIPELLSNHHLYIGKAGGAIVQESIAACCPILISHVVPGQEEGNINMIERRDIGLLANPEPSKLAASVESIFADDAVIWKKWKKNIHAISNPCSSGDIATFILKTAQLGAVPKNIERSNELLEGRFIQGGRRDF